MALLVWIEKNSRESDRLLDRIKTVVPGGSLEVFQDLCGFARRLRRPEARRPLAVLMAETRRQLADAAGLGRLLDGIKIILIAPDQDRDTIARAHAIRPRYLTFTGGDYSDVVEVLVKMNDGERGGGGSKTPTHDARSRNEDNDVH